MRKYAPTTNLSEKQKSWMKKQKLYGSHPIYKDPLVRKICEMFDGRVTEVNNKKLELPEP